MLADVDQSGKIERTQMPTVLALANDINFSILIPAQTKRTILRELERRRSTQSRTTQRMLIFATLVFLLLKEKIEKLDIVTIDVEYQGHGPTIKGHILNLFRREGMVVGSDRIRFHRIGKKSPAHDLAIKVFKGKVLPDREITAEEVLEEFRQ